MYPDKGTVCFSAGLHGWAFTLTVFAKLYAKKVCCSTCHIVYGTAWYLHRRHRERVNVERSMNVCQPFHCLGAKMFHGAFQKRNCCRLSPAVMLRDLRDLPAWVTFALHQRCSDTCLFLHAVWRG